MNILIAGGGKLGSHLAINLLDQNHDVILIDMDKSKCRKISNKLDIETICGDATDIKTLSRANLSKMDCFIAVTGKDQDNFVAAQLAKNKYNVKRVISRANNPKNLEVMRSFGSDIVVSSTEIITKSIEQEIETAGIRLLASLNKGEASICTLTVSEHSKAIGFALKDVSLPDETLIVSIVRNDKLIIPKGDTVITANDEIVAICDNKSKKPLLKLLS